MNRIDLNRRDTICALATAPAPSAIALVRVSGPNAIAIKDQIFFSNRGTQRDFVATLGEVRRGENKLDEALCTVFPGQKSYTGEPLFELSLHGNPLIAQQILDALVILGCRLAEPGEFSLRAVLNGKLDLAEAEAVCDLIHARSTQATQAALRNLNGGLSNYLEPVRVTIIDALCELEARLDFPDEGLGQNNRDHLLKALKDSLDSLKKLLATAQMGHRLTHGARVVLYGLPNAGKSTLLNALLEEEKAIVHESPGTTRDVLEAGWVLEGIPVTLVDVAGIRSGALDPVEIIGIERAQKELLRADVVLWLRDSSADCCDNLELSTTAPLIKVETKSDLAPFCEGNLSVSAKTGAGLTDLRAALLLALVNESPSQTEVLLTQSRQKEEVVIAYRAIAASHEALEQELADEVICSELRQAGAALDRLLGKSLSEDVLDLIFSRFCIGK